MEFRMPRKSSLRARKASPSSTNRVGLYFSTVLKTPDMLILVVVSARGAIRRITLWFTDFPHSSSGEFISSTGLIPSAHVNTRAPGQYRHAAARQQNGETRLRYDSEAQRR